MTPEIARQQVKDAVAADIAKAKARRERVDAAKAAAKPDDWLAGTTAGKVQQGWRRYAANWAK